MSLFDQFFEHSFRTQVGPRAIFLASLDLVRSAIFSLLHLWESKCAASNYRSLKRASLLLRFFSISQHPGSKAAQQDEQ